jgi:hypothetical protein
MYVLSSISVQKSGGSQGAFFCCRIPENRSKGAEAIFKGAQKNSIRKISQKMKGKGLGSWNGPNKDEKHQGFAPVLGLGIKVFNFCYQVSS